MSQISRINRLQRQLMAPQRVASVLATFRMDGRVCIVTGASSGLGARFAKVLHQVGAKVVVCARRADRMAELQAECNGELTVVTCDVVRAEDRERLVATTLEAHGRIDCLINNAGISIDDGQPATKIAPETLRKSSQQASMRAITNSGEVLCVLLSVSSVHFGSRLC